MNANLKRIMDRLVTDTSGKWISVEQAEKLVWATINECADYMESIQSDRDLPRHASRIYNNFKHD